VGFARPTDFAQSSFRSDLALLKRIEEEASRHGVGMIVGADPGCIKRVSSFHQSGPQRDTMAEGDANAGSPRFTA
jgi:hypothetical protein